MQKFEEKSGVGEQQAASPIVEYPIHPLCALFPDLPPDELSELAESIKRDEQQEPAVIYEGQLLDGKNRQAACRLAGKALRITPLEPGVDPVKLVASRNLLRRNLTTGQRAAIGVEIKKWCAQEAEKRMKTGKAPDPSADLREGVKASEQAAKLVKVSARTIEAAEKVKKESPALFKQVAAGEKTVNAAVKQLPKAEVSEPTPSPAKPKDKFVVVLWDDQTGVREPTKFYTRKTYPNIVYFHLWRPGACHLRRAVWNYYEILFAVSPCSEKPIQAASVDLCRSATRFLSLSVFGQVPAPEVVPNQAIEGGLDGIIKALSQAWPTARKILVSNRNRAPEGWELLNELSRKSN